MSKKAEEDNVQQSATEGLFLSGSLALDLMNTEMVVRGKKHDVLSSSDALAHWWKEACRQHPDISIVETARKPIVWESTLLDDVKALRMALRTLSTHVVEQQTVEEGDLEPLNGILALGYSSLERTAQGNVKSVIRLRNPEKGNVLFPIAMSALRLFTESDWQRLHKCRNDRCTLFFYDTTKSGTRHWCSLGCMNRSRSIHHYQATKKM